MRQHYSSGTSWEEIVSYSRAIRIGELIQVSGTTATDEQGKIVGKEDPAEQTRQALHNIRTALRALGGDLANVVRTRMYVTNIDHWKAIGRVHGEVFRGINPVTTMVEVSRLIDPDMLVEIEAEAVITAPEQS